MPDIVRKSLLIFLRVVLIALAIFLVLKLGKYFIPFILAFIFSSMIEPLVKFIEKRLKISRKIGSILSILVILGTVVTVLTFIITRLVKEIINVYESLNITIDGVTAFIYDLVDKANNLFISLPVEVADAISKTVTDVTNNLENLLKPIVDIAQGTIKFAFSIPQALIFFIVTLLATYFMSSDKHKIVVYLEKQIPSEWMKNTRAVTNNVFVALFGWLKAQLILMSITFSEVLTGLLIIGIENALLVALMVAVVDALPVLGAGSVLVPWGIVNLLSGNTRLGLSLILLNVIILFVRQLIEPRVIGHQIGIHPLFTLFGMYMGLQFFGIIGMILGPISMVILKYLLEGILKANSIKSLFERIFRSKGKVTLATSVGETEPIKEHKDIKDKKG